MLGALIKNEFKATVRILFAIYGSLILFAVLNRLLVRNMAREEGLIALIFDSIYIMLNFAVLILALFLIVRRFILGLREIDFSVPINSIVIGRLIPSFCWAAASFFVVGLGATIVGADSWVVEDFPLELLAFFNTFQQQGILLPLSVLTGIATLIAGILGFYSALTVGFLMKRAKFFWALLFYLIMNYALSILFFSSVDMIARGLGIVDDMANVEAAAFTVILIATLLQGVVHYCIISGVFKHMRNSPSHQQQQL